jgi:two-component system NarL family sensor kinase
MSSRVESNVVPYLNRDGMARELDGLRRAKARYRARAKALDAKVRSRTSEVEKQSQELRDLSSRLLQAQDDERRRIARELHDSAGQTLALLSMGLAQAVQHAPSTTNLFAKYTNECEQLVHQLSREIRTMSYLLHPPLLDEMGLTKATQGYIDGLMQRCGLTIALEVSADFPRLRRELELVMFRLVQECLTNIHRHSGSKRAIICFTSTVYELSLSIRDSGTGIPPDKLLEIQVHGSGVGISGMRERVRFFGGRMAIELSHRGTMVLFKFPISEIVTARQARLDTLQNTGEETAGAA